LHTAVISSACWSSPAMKEVALDQGVYASFMPKPFT